MLKFFGKKIFPTRGNMFINIAKSSSLSLNIFNKFEKLNFCTKDTEKSDKEEDALAEEKTEYDFLHLAEKENSHSHLDSLMNHVKCQGCGIHLQTEEKNKIGFIPQKKLNDYVDASDNVKNLEDKFKIEEFKNEEHNEEDRKINEFELIHDKATLKRLMKLKNARNVLICERCYKLKNYSNFEDLKDLKDVDETKDQKNKKKEKDDKIDNYTLLVKKINAQRLIHQIMSRISDKAHIFYICVNIY
jgi:hypothetical protein